MKSKTPKTVPAHESVHTLIGPKTVFKGTLRFEGAIRIDGEFEGNIYSEGALIIGEQGKIKGDIRVGDAVVHGLVLGNIYASRRVELMSPGHVVGDLTTPSLHVGHGAIFEGRSHTRDEPTSPDVFVSPKSKASNDLRPN